jgi:molybdate transport system substrate-binding protein
MLLPNVLIDRMPSYHIGDRMAGGTVTLEVLCARSMTTAVTALARDFTRASGRKLDLTFGTVGALQAKLAAGASADVLVLGAPAIAKMEQAGAVVPGSRRDIARTSIGVAVREGAPAPDISTPDAFKRALSAARVVAFSDPAVGGSAGVYLAGLWGRIGMADEIGRKGVPQQSGGEVAARVAEGKADIGLTLVAEIVPVKGACVIGRLPAPFGNDTTYAAGISVGCTDRAAAAGFIAALADPAGRDVWTAAGFDRVG